MPLGYDWSRKLEPLYTHSEHVAEWWNTWSNILFVAIGVIQLRGSLRNARLYALLGDEYVMPRLWLLYTLAGFCSAFHHSQHRPWTIVVDWVPIASSIVTLLMRPKLLRAISLAALVGFAFAFLVLAVDHAATVALPPWGHVQWHQAAAYSIAYAYGDLELYYIRRFALPRDVRDIREGADAGGRDLTAAETMKSPAPLLSSSPPPPPPPPPKTSASKIA
jgi:hypothetical protein